MFTAQPLLTQRVVRAQLGLVPLLGLLAFLWAGSEAAVAAMYGAFVALAMTALLVWRESQCVRHPEWDQHRLMKRFVGAGIERLVLLVGLLAIGFGGLSLLPLPLLLGLVGAQFAWLAAAVNGKQALKK